MKVLVALGLLCVALTACTPDRTANMSCEDLRLDNLSRTETMPVPPSYEDLAPVRENNKRVQELGCAWANDDHSGPA